MRPPLRESRPAGDDQAVEVCLHWKLREAEYVRPRTEAGRAIAAMRRHGERPAPVLLVSEIRTVAAADVCLSPRHGDPCFGIHFTFRRESEAVRAVLPAMETGPGELGAPHWGKAATMAPAKIAARFPRLREFRGLAQTLDPGREVPERLGGSDRVRRRPVGGDARIFGIHS